MMCRGRFECENIVDMMPTSEVNSAVEASKVNLVNLLIALAFFAVSFGYHLITLADNCL
jgi:hypothetical protein